MSGRSRKVLQRAVLPDVPRALPVVVVAAVNGKPPGPIFPHLDRVVAQAAPDHRQGPPCRTGRRGRLRILFVMAEFRDVLPSLEMVRKRLGISCRVRTLKRVLRRLGFSYSKPRPIPDRSASEAEQEEFKQKTAGLLEEMGKQGHAVMVCDEAAVQI